MERCLTLCGNSLLSSEERGCECEVGRGEVRVGEGRCSAFRIAASYAHLSQTQRFLWNERKNVRSINRD